MYLQKISKDVFSICQKDTCITATGDQAKVIGTVITAAIVVLSIATLFRAD